MAGPGRLPGTVKTSLATTRLLSLSPDVLMLDRLQELSKHIATFGLKLEAHLDKTERYYYRHMLSQISAISGHLEKGCSSIIALDAESNLRSTSLRPQKKSPHPQISSIEEDLHKCFSRLNMFFLLELRVNRLNGIDKHHLLEASDSEFALIQQLSASLLQQSEAFTTAVDGAARASQAHAEQDVITDSSANDTGNGHQERYSSNLALAPHENVDTVQRGRKKTTDLWSCTCWHIYLCVGVSSLGSLIFAVLWSALAKDISGAFGIAQYVLGIGGLVVLTMFGQHNTNCVKKSQEKRREQRDSSRELIVLRNQTV